MVGHLQILCMWIHKNVVMVGWPTIMDFVIFLIFFSTYHNDTYHLSTPRQNEITPVLKQRETHTH